MTISNENMYDVVGMFCYRALWWTLLAVFVLMQLILGYTLVDYWYLLASLVAISLAEVILLLRRGLSLNDKPINDTIFLAVAIWFSVFSGVTLVPPVVALALLFILKKYRSSILINLRYLVVAISLMVAAMLLPQDILFGFPSGVILLVVYITALELTLWGVRRLFQQAGKEPMK